MKHVVPKVSLLFAALATSLSACGNDVSEVGGSAGSGAAGAGGASSGGGGAGASTGGAGVAGGGAGIGGASGKAGSAAGGAGAAGSAGSTSGSGGTGGIGGGSAGASAAAAGTAGTGGAGGVGGGGAAGVSGSAGQGGGGSAGSGGTAGKGGQGGSGSGQGGASGAGGQGGSAGSVGGTAGASGASAGASGAAGAGGSCVAPDHECNGACVSSTDTATCGASCNPCPVPANGAATCDGVSCGITCTGVLSPCNGACIDETQDTQNCGGCGASCTAPTGGQVACKNSACVVTVDASQTALWQRSAPQPYLAFWKDGAVLASAVQSAVVIGADSSHTVTSFTAAGRPSIYIPTGGTNPSVAMVHYGSFDAYTQSNVQAWSNPIHGCCGFGVSGFPHDPAQGLMYTGHGITEIDTGTGTTARAQDTFIQGVAGYLVSPSSLYQIRANLVTRFARSDLSQVWQVALPAGDSTDFPPAFTATEGVVVGSVAGGLLTHFRHEGTTAWSIPVTNPTAPVITAGGLAIVGTGTGAASTLSAYRLTDGGQQWSVPCDDRVLDVLVADDGLVYVAINAQAYVLAFEQATGVLRATYNNVTPAEMLLRDGNIYVSGAGKVTVFPVPAKKYDPASPWPVRFHDNQRTSSSIATLDY